MLTKDDKKFIVDSITGAILKNNVVLIERLDEAVNKLGHKFEKRIDNLSKDVVDLFEATNSVIKKVDNKLSDKIDKVNEDLSDRIDRVLDQLRDDDESINDHDKRIGKLEEKIFVATTSS